MAVLLIQHHVKDFAEWKKAFDSSLGLRKANGELSTQVYQGVEDSNAVTVINKWDTLERAQNFAGSPDLKAAMEKAGVESPPAVTFLKEA
jgi:heme-degrading monooxygenase HmoA